MPPETNAVHRVLRVGDRGPDVRSLQREINQRDRVPNIDVDGVFGNATSEAAHDTAWFLGADERFLDNPGFGEGLQKIVRFPGRRTPAQRRRARRRRRPTMITAAQLGLRFQNVFGLKGVVDKLAGHYTAGHRAANRAALAAEMKADHAFHLSKGWGGLSYEIMVADDGTLGLGNPTWRKSAAVAAMNTGMINLCHPGTTGDKMTPQARRTMIWVLRNWHTRQMPREHRLPRQARGLDMRGHKEWPNNPTACPGDMLPQYHEIFRSF